MDQSGRCHYRVLTDQIEEGREIDSGDGRQEQVNRYFDSAAEYWKAIYADPTVPAAIYQERMATALAWIDELALPEGAPILEIGCGAGLTSVALAERGFTMTATDGSPAMIELTNQLAQDRNLADRIHTSLVDAHRLPFEDGSYAFVIALGVFAWLHSPELALKEISRVLRPEGLMLVSVDNIVRLNHLLDPFLNPALGPVRRRLGNGLRRIGIMQRSTKAIPAHFDSPRRFNAAIARAGMDRVRSTTIGFGPFTLWNRPILSDRAGMRLHGKLQDLASRGVPLVRDVGSQYVVLARKRDGT